MRNDKKKIISISLISLMSLSELSNRNILSKLNPFKRSYDPDCITFDGEPANEVGQCECDANVNDCDELKNDANELKNDIDTNDGTDTAPEGTNADPNTNSQEGTNADASAPYPKVSVSFSQNETPGQVNFAITLEESTRSAESSDQYEGTYLEELDKKLKNQQHHVETDLKLNCLKNIDTNNDYHECNCQNDVDQVDNCYVDECHDNECHDDECHNDECHDDESDLEIEGCNNKIKPCINKILIQQKECPPPCPPPSPKPTPCKKQGTLTQISNGNKSTKIFLNKKMLLLK